MLNLNNTNLPWILLNIKITLSDTEMKKKMM